MRSCTFRYRSMQYENWLASAMMALCNATKLAELRWLASKDGTHIRHHGQWTGLDRGRRHAPSRSFSSSNRECWTNSTAAAGWRCDRRDSTWNESFCLRCSSVHWLEAFGRQMEFWFVANLLVDDSGSLSQPEQRRQWICCIVRDPILLRGSKCDTL